MSSAPQHKPQLDFLKMGSFRDKNSSFFFSQLLKLNESLESLNGLCNSSRKLVILGH